MFEVTLNDGNTFVFQKFSEIEEFFSEVVFGEGADDAKISIKMADIEDYLWNLRGIIPFKINNLRARQVSLYFHAML